MNLKNNISYSKQTIVPKDINEVNKVLKSDFITQGPINLKFEKKINNYVGSKYCSTANSATSALLAACKALGLGKGDRLWTSTNSFVASSNSGLLCGAKVDLIDINLFNYNLDIDQLEKKLKLAKKKNKLPKIVMPIHFAGYPCDMKKIFSLSKKFKFKIIEDASHALGSARDGVKVGSCKYSDITVFSFHAVKVITTGEGGCLTTNDQKLYKKFKSLISHGITKEQKFYKNKKNKFQPWYFEQQQLGFNFRMPDINAALGLSQLSRINKYRKRRNILVNNYYKIFKNTKFKFIKIPKNIKSSHHLLPVFFNFKDFKEKINFFNFLKKKRIYLQVHYIPIYKHPYYQGIGFKKKIFKNSETYYKNIFSLPLYPSLTKKEQIYIYNSFNNFLKKRKY